MTERARLPLLLCVEKGQLRKFGRLVRMHLGVFLWRLTRDIQLGGNLQVDPELAVEGLHIPYGLGTPRDPRKEELESVAGERVYVWNTPPGTGKYLAPCGGEKGKRALLCIKSMSRLVRRHFSKKQPVPEHK